MEENKIITTVEIDSQQAQQELIKLNSVATNSTKSLEDRISAKNKAVEIQNKLAEKDAIKTREKISNLKEESNLLLATIQDENKRSAALKGSLIKQDEYAQSVKNLDTAKRELALINRTLKREDELLEKQTLSNLKVQQQNIVQLDKLKEASSKAAIKLQEQAKAEARLSGENINLSSTFEEVYGDLKPLTGRMGEAEDRLYELALAGKTATSEYQELLEVVSNYKRTQQETDRIVDGAATTLTQKLTGGATLAATGFQSLTAGMALVGVEGESTQKALLKVQAAMSFSESIRGLSEMGGQYRAFKSLVISSLTSMTTARTADIVSTEASVVAENTSTVSKIKGAASTVVHTTATGIATAAQWLWNTAVMANPIVALVVALAAAAAGIYYFTKMLLESSTANEKAANDTKKLEKALDKESLTLARTSRAVREKNEQTLAMAKANGQSSESIRKLERKLIDEQIATDKASTITARNTFIQERNSLAKLKAAGASDEVIKAREKEVQVAYDTFKRENSQLDSSYKERAKLVRTQEVEIASEKTQANKKSIEDGKKAADERKKADEKRVKDEYDRKKKEAKSLIDLEELSLKKNKEDPKNDTLEQEKGILSKKRDYELMNLDLLESEKNVIREKYLQEERELIIKSDETKSALLLEKQKEQLSLDEMELSRKRSLGESTLALELEFLDKKREQDLAALNLTEGQKALIEAGYKESRRKTESEDMERKLEEQIAIDEQDLVARQLRGENIYGLEKALREKARQQELSDLSLSEEAKAAINKKYDNANTAARNEAIEQDLNNAAEAFGISKELAVAKMVMNAPQAVGNSFTKAAEVYPAPLSLAMGALGAAGVIVPIVKGLSDIKKTRFPGKSSKGNGGGGNISSSTGGGVAQAAVGNLAANNIARLGVDPSLKSAATSDATNNVMGGSGGSIVFSEGRYSDFKGQVEFKEKKSTI